MLGYGLQGLTEGFLKGYNLAQLAKQREEEQELKEAQLLLAQGRKGPGGQVGREEEGGQEPFYLPWAERTEIPGGEYESPLGMETLPRRESIRTGRIPTGFTRKEAKGVPSAFWTHYFETLQPKPEKPMEIGGFPFFPSTGKYGAAPPEKGVQPTEEFGWGQRRGRRTGEIFEVPIKPEKPEKEELTPLDYKKGFREYQLKRLGDPEKYPELTFEQYKTFADTGKLPVTEESLLPTIRDETDKTGKTWRKAYPGEVVKDAQGNWIWGPRAHDPGYALQNFPKPEPSPKKVREEIKERYKLNKITGELEPTE